ncbi:SRPBCC family protein [Bailinhaonella thermotolerans]|uniref:SRPBCC domain-containing protein n=1 Tax=Bailinhaonella thermotolerans TaxID=1070861 RepID=A0A3A4A6A5_9ACTN|nr:SRPBCC domain-containing protein [Bailinhaonella thermotolerans]RJL24436.1 SRPBCC domain-containing protein [Bailinhaonella thermotolerans]
MGHRFETSHETEVAATPEQVWEAIATGPGITSWFMGRNEVEPGEGGVVRLAFGDYSPEQPITAWDPGRRLAYGAEPGPDGRFVAYEFLVEGRERGSAVIRVVTSGFLPGDDWEDEFEAMSRGGALFFRTLVEYLGRFAGRAATPITVAGPPAPDLDHAWAALRKALGLPGVTAIGDRVRLAPGGGLPEIDGVVYFADDQALGVRAGDAMYRFVRGFFGALVVQHLVFADVDVSAAESAWSAWLTPLSA